MQKRGKAAGGASLSAKSLELREPSGRETAGKPAEQQKKGRAEKGRKRGREGLGRRTKGKEGMKELKLFRLKTARGA